MLEASSTNNYKICILKIRALDGTTDFFSPTWFGIYKTETIEELIKKIDKNKTVILTASENFEPYFKAGNKFRCEEYKIEEYIRNKRTLNNN